MDTQVCIIGAGVVGLAIARQLSRIYNQVIILEKNEKFGQEISSRNSEVIHSGIYYPKNSLKSILCVKGNEFIYQFAHEKKIPHSKCGKLIVAQSNEEIRQLNELKQQADLNGVKETKVISREEILAYEPNISALKALLVPSTGIIDSHSLMKNYLNDAIYHKADIAYNSEVSSIERIENGYLLRVEEEAGNSFKFSTSIVINSAGLKSNHISSLLGIKDVLYKLNPCKGEYFRIKSPKDKLVNRLVYPVPPVQLQGLGVHATKELDGGLKLGPNLEYISESEINYSVNPDHIDEFYQSAKPYLPFLKKSDLIPEMVGIRPKLQGPGEEFRDFIIKNESKRGYPNFINLLGIESPGLSASMAIAEYVESIIQN